MTTMTKKKDWSHIESNGVPIGGIEPALPADTRFLVSLKIKDRLDRDAMCAILANAGIAVFVWQRGESRYVSFHMNEKEDKQ